MLLTNPDGSPIVGFDCFVPREYTLEQIVALQSFQAATIATVGVAVAALLAFRSRRKTEPFRFSPGVRYLMAATAGLWIFAIGAAFAPYFALAH